MKHHLMANESISNGKLHFTETYSVNPKLDEGVKSKFVLEAKKESSNGKLILKPRIEAIHAGRTRNNTIYTGEKLKGDFQLKSGIYSFMHPYPKPMLKNHDRDSEPTGRVKNAQFVKDPLTGKESVIIIPEITDPDAIEKVLDGRYLTVSIGATTDSARCNICGTDQITEGWCDHDRGVEYEGTVCGWIIGNVWFDECSWVTVPSDPQAQVVDVGEAVVMEAYVEQDNKIFDLTNKGGAEINKEYASMLGLVASKESDKGGSIKVPEPKENEVTVTAEELSALKDKASKVDTLEAEVAAKDATIAEKDTALQAKEAELATKEQELAAKDATIAEKETQITDKETQITTLTTEKTELETQVTDLTTEKTTLESEKQGLLDQNTQLLAKAHDDLVEQVVDLKIALGKTGAEEKDTAVESHKTRTTESLVDSYNDLMTEAKEGKLRARDIQHVDNPGRNVAPGEELEASKDKPLTDGAVIQNLLTGKLRKQK